MNVLALCAGVGGLERGVQIAVRSARLVAAVEREAYAAAILAARMEDGRLDQAPIWSDIRTFDGSAWRGCVDLITAGYPCKGESSAGRRTGTDHEFWLWDDVWRIARDVGPRYLFLENVAAHVSRSFRHVLGDLAAAGWAAEWQCVRASDVGAPHIRDRVFVLVANPERSELRVQPGRAEHGRTCEVQPRANGEAEAVAHADSGRWVAGGRDLCSRESNAGRGGAPYTDESGLQGPVRAAVPIGEFAESAWADAPRPQPAIRGVDDGMACGMDVRANRLYVCGNGVVPEQAAAAFRVLWERLHDAG